MNHTPITFASLYQAGLRAHLQGGRNASLDPAQVLGVQATAEGLLPLDLATLHEATLIADELPGCPARRRDSLLRRAGRFFGVALSAMETNPGPDPQPTSAHLLAGIGTLSRRCVELATANLALGREIAGHHEVEATLREREDRYSRSLATSDRLQEQLRQLSRQLLVAQEEERKRISRELHDVVAQSLAGINIRLSLLKREAALNTKGLVRNIAITQRMVKKSTGIVQQFVRDLRPTLLDDLGLIPALQAYLESFTERTGVRSHLKAGAEVDQLDGSLRTALFRIAQEALANVARHARATRVEVMIEKLPTGICLTVTNDGNSFDVESLLKGPVAKRLGLLGMMERAEMVGGTFEIESAPGQGTTVTVRLPFDGENETSWQNFPTNPR